MLEVSHVCVQTSRKQGLCWGSWHFPERKGKQMMIDKSVINLALSITQGASVLRTAKLHNIKMIKVRLNCTSSLVFSFKWNKISSYQFCFIITQPFWSQDIVSSIIDLWKQQHLSLELISKTLTCVSVPTVMELISL